MNFDKKKKELQEQFNKLQKEITFLNNEISNRQQELYRIQGEFRLIKQLQDNKKNNAVEKHKDAK